MVDRGLEHCVVATVIIVNKERKYLIAKRADWEKNFPGKWTVPGGKLDPSDYVSRRKDSVYHWHNVLEHAARREVRQEVGLEIGALGYVTNSVYLMSDGLPCLVVSLFANAKSENVMLCNELIDSIWVSSEEAKSYDLIDGIYGELKLLDEKLRHGDNAIREILAISRKN